MRRQQGVALMMVLWVLMLLSMMLSGITLLLRGESRQALWDRQQTTAQLAAGAGISLAVQAMQQPATRRWQAAGETHDLRFDGMNLRVTLRSERGLLDINSGDSGAVGQLLAACGASAAAPALLARREQQPFRVTRELRSLPGVTASRFACLSPHITVWSGMAQPDIAFATPLLRRVLHLPLPGMAKGDPGQVLRVVSRATLPGGRHRTLTVTLLLTHASAGDRPYRVLGWQEG